MLGGAVLTVNGGYEAISRMTACGRQPTCCILNSALLLTLVWFDKTIVSLNDAGVA